MYTVLAGAASGRRVICIGMTFCVCDIALKKAVIFYESCYSDKLLAHQAENCFCLVSELKLCMDVEIVLVQHSLHLDRQRQKERARGSAFVYQVMQTVIQHKISLPH